MVCSIIADLLCLVVRLWPSRSKSQWGLGTPKPDCPLITLWITEPFIAKLCMMVHHHDLECYLCERFECSPPQGQGHSTDCWTKTKMNVTHWLSVPCLLNCSAFFSFFSFFFSSFSCSQTWYRCMCIISSHITPHPHPLPNLSPQKKNTKQRQHGEQRIVV